VAKFPISRAAAVPAAAKLVPGIAPPSASCFDGNAGRDTFMGPGLATWDFSVVKDNVISERLQLQFSRGNLQSAEPRKLQYAESDRIHAADGLESYRAVGHRRSDHQHSHNRDKSDSA
jgi:hypothetical protein